MVWKVWKTNKPKDLPNMSLFLWGEESMVFDTVLGSTDWICLDGFTLRPVAS